MLKIKLSGVYTDVNSNFPSLKLLSESEYCAAAKIESNKENVVVEDVLKGNQAWSKNHDAPLFFRGGEPNGFVTAHLNIY